MMDFDAKIKLMEAKKLKENLIIKVNCLLIDYKEYQSFFQKGDGYKAKDEANSRYYSYMMDLMHVGAYEECRFSLEHTSLTTCMEENKKERALLVEQIKKVKLKIKNLLRN